MEDESDTIKIEIMGAIVRDCQDIPPHPTCNLSGVEHYQSPRSSVSEDMAYLAGQMQTFPHPSKGLPESDM
jgi:hypothetical protein